ncbi:unnamed protein product [Musa acuminata subsp. burmannicoides]
MLLPLVVHLHHPIHQLVLCKPGGVLLICLYACLRRLPSPLCKGVNSLVSPLVCQKRSDKDMEGDKHEVMEGEEARVTDVSLKELSKKLEEFARERDWEQYHSPRNLLLAMVGEVGELAEIFMWRGEVAKGLPNWKDSEKEHVGEELSDVLLYLIRLSDVCGIDLGDAATKKIVKNAIKYPPKAT